MSHDDRLLNRTNLVITLLIAVAAASMSVASYSYSSHASDAVRKNALDEVHANAAGSAHNLSEILAVKMETVTTNLKFMSESQRIREQQVPQSQNLFRTAQASTRNITDSYLWLDENGKILWSSSFANATLLEQFVGADRSDRAYFAVPKETLRPHITSVINSVDNNPRFYVSYPVLADDPQENFRGTVVASVQPISIGRFLQSKIARSFRAPRGCWAVIA